MKKVNSSISNISFFIVILLLVLGTRLTYGMNVSELKSGGDSTSTYLIKLPHTADSCLATLDKISKDTSKLLAKIDWGCMSGDHTGYLIVNSKDEKSALEMLPASIRDQAKIEKVDKFTKEQIEAFHKKK